MQTIASRVIPSSVQVDDGRTRARERHTGYPGVAHGHEHLAAIGLDTDGVPAARPAMTGVA
ncbi:hypothetical protein C8R32_101366 [Nitrosospira sp. Nsp5]|uniref:Amidohydrolase n=1 Tax=Nitrosospira multiformis TaxID=1231 RepID=A0ABY0TKA3_9PROT|nr:MULTISPECIES: hypothetical protein [Nitrosospira]PTR10836.1 hypothetical protein C8R32_101366 [Nitrosospira sp. Nsp5]SDQ73856.1 hypothetical protein SAMN05216402_2089 [Nitrosospira multiformis]